MPAASIAAALTSEEVSAAIVMVSLHVPPTEVQCEAQSTPCVASDHEPVAAGGGGEDTQDDAQFAAPAVGRPQEPQELQEPHVSQKPLVP